MQQLRKLSEIWLERRRWELMREVMQYELETKKKHLLKLQDYFCSDIKDIESPKYEDNAINALLEMKKVKTEIEQLGYYLQLK